MNPWRSVVAAVVALALTGPAAAADGVFQINDTCAQVGCFAGDTAGYPVQITAPGSYRLTSNLDTRGSPNPIDHNAIEVSAPGSVSVDLNGFTLIGPVTCSGTPVTSCSPTGGFGGGVNVTTSSPGARIFNGSVRGFAIGIDCGGGCVAEDLTVSETLLVGITNANFKAIVRNNLVERGGGDGIFASGRIEGNLVRGHTDTGIFANPDSVLIGNQSIDNGGNGFRCFTCLLLDNISTDNGGFGVLFGGRATYGRNLFTDNTGGETSGTGVQLGPNRCGAVLCP